jgi:hypothetical protein
MPFSVKNLANIATIAQIRFLKNICIFLNSLRNILHTIMALVLQNLTSVHQETASFGPGRRFCDFAKASTAQALFCNPRNSQLSPAFGGITKMLMPCPER